MNYRLLAGLLLFLAALTQACSQAGAGTVTPIAGALTPGAEQPTGASPPTDAAQPTDTALPADATPPLAATQPDTPSPIQTPAQTEQAEAPNVPIYLVAIGDAGKSGIKIGCDDSLVPVELPAPEASGLLEAALRALLSLKDQYYGQSGLYNALYQSNLTLEDMSLDDAGRVTIRLAGEYAIEGECDIPRFQGQLEQTVLQFSTVKEVSFLLNGLPLYEALSLIAPPNE